MIKTNARMDEGLERTVRKAVMAHVPDREQAEAIIADLTKEMMPAYGATSLRRRAAADIRGAFKDGFGLGKNASRFSRWHDMIWRGSETFRRMTAMASDNTGAIERFSRFNYD